MTLSEKAKRAAERFTTHYGTMHEWATFQDATQYIDEYYEEWLKGKKNIDPDVGETAKLCAEYSPTWLSILINDPEESGGFISLAFTPFPEDTSGFEEIYPQDIAIYCARIDALRLPEHEQDIKPMFAELHYDDGFKKFPKATARFVVTGMIQRLKAKIMFWKTPKWERIREKKKA